ncbi:MAG: 2-succinyl-6-hydroxy-2,4-cyclohexadiene-1-carboxylate synthase [Balneolales bacterium]
MKTTIRGIPYWIEHYHSHDDLPTLVMLHGFMGSSGSFYHLTDALREFANLVYIDLLGHGETNAPSNSQRYAPDQQVADLHAILQKFGGKPLILHGYSMGGRLALQYACRHPGHLDKLILESTTAGITDKSERDIRKRTDRTRAMQILEDKDRFIKEWNNASLFQNKESISPDVEEQLEAIQQAQNSIGLQNSLICFGTGSMSPLHDQLNTIDIPTLILAGANDEKFKQEGRILNDLIQNSKYSEIENAAHRIHLDNPIAYLEKIKDIIQEK